MTNPRQETAIAYLKRAVEESGLTPTALARAIGVQPSTINRPLSGKPGTHAVSPDTLLKVRDVTKCAFDDALVAAFGFPPLLGIAPALMDPASGTGGFLVAALKELATNDVMAKRLKDFAQSRTGAQAIEDVGGGRALVDALKESARSMATRRMGAKDSETKLETPPQDLQPNTDWNRAHEIEAGARDLPVYGSAKAGFDGAEIDCQTVQDWIERPPVLRGAKDACACYVVSDSMEPRYFQGDTLLIHPGKPPRAGDFVFVELLDHKAIVKRLVKRADDYVELEQLNPPKRQRFKRQDIVAISRIVGSLSD